MRLSIVAVGRLGARTPEAALVADYLARATAAGRPLGLTPVDLVEVEGRKPGKPAEAEALSAALDAGCQIVACDEHGQAWPSRRFAERIARWRDDGVRRTALLVGGADGLDASLLSRARDKIAFGPQTWPHALARVMIAEQLYRAVTILSGSPYHRD